MKRLLICIFVALICLQCVSISVFAENVYYYDTHTMQTAATNCDILDDIGDLFTGASANNAAKIDEEVYLGGYPLGITIDGDGVTVIGLNEFIAEDGKLVCPAMQAGIEIRFITQQSFRK